MHIRAPSHLHGLMHAQAHRSFCFSSRVSISSSFFSPCVWFAFVSPHVPTQLAIDVWNVPEDAGADEYFGKVVVKIADWLESPQAAWHFLLPGQLQISATWTPYLDADRERLLKGSPVALTLEPEPRAAKAAPAVSTIPASSPKAAPAAATAMATGSNEPPAPSPPPPLAGAGTRSLRRAHGSAARRRPEARPDLAASRRRCVDCGCTARVAGWP